MEPLSPRNSEVARLRALARERRARHEAGRFVVEGIKLVTEAVQSDLVVFEAYVEGDWDPPVQLQQALSDDDVDITLVSTRGIERIASTTSPQPILAEVKLPQTEWSDLGESPSLLVAVDLNQPQGDSLVGRCTVPRPDPGRTRCASRACSHR